MKSLLIILSGLAASWHFTDIESENSLYSLWCPLGVAFFLIALLFCLVLKAGFGNKTTRGDSGSSLDFFDGGGGGC